jgi:putative aminopeptidase FrvX
MTTAAQRETHRKWLDEMTSLPTAAGREDRVIAWVETWVARRRNLRLRGDKAGNLFITRKGSKPRGIDPIYITAHLDHPAFVVVDPCDGRTVELEFRGGVHDPYFENAQLEIFDADDRAHRATIVEFERDVKTFKKVTARLTAKTGALAPGDVGRWRFNGRLPRVSKGIYYTHACDDLAALAAGVSALDVLRRRHGTSHVGLLLTRAEEVGFVGTLAACRDRSVPKKARLICLENSRSFPESPIGGGPIVRVGDRLSVFSPALTNRISDLMMAHAEKHPDFRWQRRLMPGGACEATAFSTYGYESTCLCLPLGNYHNMADIDGVLAGQRPAEVGPEHIALEDYHGLVEMLIVCATQLDGDTGSSLERRLEGLLSRHGRVLER